MKKKSVSFRVALATAALLVIAAPVSAQFKKPADAIDYRQSAFTVMAAHFGRIGAVVKGAAPYDAKTTAANAAVVSTLASLPFTAFGPGTDKGKKTGAKPNVWTDAAGFKAAADKMVAAVAKLDTAAKSGNLDAVKAAFGETGKTCKGCHDDYRSK